VSLDVAIVGGEVVDGTGSGRVRADIGIRNGRIVSIGKLDEPAARQIDAEGKVVAPGFIDVHTHYDAQVMWDGALSPSPFHGVTTVLAGNCGFTLAPLSKDSAPYVTEMLARVEGMPLETLREGLDFGWQTFGQYLDRIKGNVAVNIGLLVGHSTIRRLALGEDWRRAASDEEVASMKQLVAQSIEAGALGFSTTWSESHNDGNGDPVPSRFATPEELIELSTVLRDYPGTWLEFTPIATQMFPEDRIGLMAEMSAAANRLLNWNLLLFRRDIPDEAIASRFSASDVAREFGGEVIALTLPMLAPLRLNLGTGMLFDIEPAWAAVLAQPHDQKIRDLGDPDVRKRLAAAAGESPHRWYRMHGLQFEHVESPQFADVQGKTIAAAAANRDVEPFDLLFDVALADDLRTVFFYPSDGDDPETWQRRVAAWHDPRTLIGGSDAGAHLDMLATFGYFTDLIGPTVRERKLLSLEAAIKLITYDAAAAFGLRGRGQLDIGYCADVVVFDENEVGGLPVEPREDLPANGMRLYNEATGIDYVLVNGEVIIEHGELTNARPGTVLRSGVHTTTVTPGSPRTVVPPAD
jgi:N-acyl-D-aspartate/D-glutamate deacylase